MIKHVRLRRLFQLIARRAAGWLARVTATVDTFTPTVNN
jgi:hypothetical protein